MRKNLLYVLISILIFANALTSVEAMPTSYTYNPMPGIPGAAFTNPEWKTNSPGNFVVTFDANTQNNIYVHLYAYKVSQSYVSWQQWGYYYHIKIDPSQADILCFNGETQKTSLTSNTSLKVTMGTKESWWISLKGNKSLTVGKGIYPNGITASWTIPDGFIITPTYFGFGGAGAPTYFENIKIISQTKDAQATALEYNKIVRIQSTFGGMVWTHPYYRDEKVKGTANDSLELLVNSSDARATNGCDFFLIRSADAPFKKGPINYGDKVEIYSLSTVSHVGNAAFNKIMPLNKIRTVPDKDWSGDAAYNKIWPLNRKWVANGDSQWAGSHGEVLIVGPENPKFKDDLRIFTIVSNSKKTGAINYNDEVRIVASLPNAIINNDLWIGNDHRGEGYKPVHIDDKTSRRTNFVNDRGIFKFLAPDKAKLDDPNGIAQRILAEIGDIPSASDFPTDYVSITPKDDLDIVTVGSKDGKLEIWAIDSKNKVYRFNEFAGAPYTMPDATVDPWEVQTLKDESGKDITGLDDIFATCDGNLFGIKSDNKTAVKYDFTKKQWAQIKATNATKIKLENITASKGTEIFASSEDDVIYKLENNTWKKMTTGASIAAGIGTDGKSIVIGIAKTGIPYKFENNKWTQMGKEQLSKITIGNQNYILGITLDDNLVKWDSKTKKWLDIPGKKEPKIVSVDDIAAIPSETTVAIDKFGNTYHKGSDASSLTAKGVETKKATTTTVTKAVAAKQVKAATTKNTVKTVSNKTAKKNAKKTAKKKVKKTTAKKTATTPTKKTNAKVTTVKTTTTPTTSTKSTASK